MIDRVPTSTGVVFEESKRYKTSLLVGAFPRALFIGARPAIELIGQNEYGFTPTVWPWSVSDTETIADIEDLPPRIEVLAHLQEVLEFLDTSGYAQTFGAVCNDDLSPVAHRSVRWWKLEEKTTNSGAIDHYYPYQQLAGFMVDIAGQCRHMGCHCWSTAWIRAKSYNKQKKKMFPGGPDVGSAEQSGRLPGWFDTNVRAMLDNEYPDPWMNGCLWADLRSADWKTGDRNSIAINGRRIPPNIRELLRASQTPYRLERLEGNEWQDELADEVAQAVIDYGSRTPEVWAIISRVFKGDVPETPRSRDEAFIRHAVQDGIARGVLQRMLQRATVNMDAWLKGEVGGAVLDANEEDVRDAPVTSGQPRPARAPGKRPKPPPLVK